MLAKCFNRLHDRPGAVTGAFLPGGGNYCRDDRAAAGTEPQGRRCARGGLDGLDGLAKNWQKANHASSPSLINIRDFGSQPWHLAHGPTGA
uniref:Uncharacterized protein n=1 Tax=Rhodopseudomonas palustris (strain BisA53) TaxID=316055 RepID=Q07RI2_RHOP5